MQQDRQLVFLQIWRGVHCLVNSGIIRLVVDEFAQEFDITIHDVDRLHPSQITAGLAPTM